MLIKQAQDIRESEVTDKTLIMSRRSFLMGSGALAAGLAVPQWLGTARAATTGQKLPIKQRLEMAGGETVTTYDKVSTYNNFYEFGTDKASPAEEAKQFRTRPWTVAVEGLVKKPKTYAIEDLMKMFPLQERIYRHRCVEAWSIVVPWVGFPLKDFIKKMEPSPKAKYIEFTTLMDPKQMPGESTGVLTWPYMEGLRLDEAMNNLPLLAVGMYGQVLPNQNGAPIRLVVPWKYGFKSIKSIVRIRLLANMPFCTWAATAPDEYGFYANVNPTVDHPRWSQASERRLGEFFRRKTLMFNGYEEQVAHLYKDLDLRKNF